MSNRCGCPHVLRRRALHIRFARATAVGVGGYLIAGFTLVALRAVDVIGEEVALWLQPVILIAALFVYFGMVRQVRHRLPWRNLQPGDFLQVLTFPAFHLIGWLDVLAGGLAGWRLVLMATGLTVVICLLAYEFVLRFPPSVAGFRRRAFGPMTAESRKIHMDLRRHELFCRSPDEARKARIRARALRAARHRAVARSEGNRQHRFYRFLSERVLRPYEDLAHWLSAYTVSAGIFALLFTRMEPGPAPVLMMFLPFALMPFVAFLWERLNYGRAVKVMSRLWAERWPDCPPLAERLRVAHPDRWVRFHALPDAKRRADTDGEAAIMLNRHNSVLDELFAGDDVFVVSAEWSGTPEPPVWSGARYWTSVCIEADPEFLAYTHLYVRRMAWRRGCLDGPLRCVADYVGAGMLITDVELRCVYVPYQGGADVFLTSKEERDRLRTCYAEWLAKPLSRF